MATVTVNNQEIYVSTCESKEAFAERMKAMAKNYDALADFYKHVYLKVLDDFNGKPLNNRFIVALQSRAMERDENIIIGGLNRFSDGNSYFHAGTTYLGQNSYNGSVMLHIIEKYPGTEDRLINSAASIKADLPWKKELKTKEAELKAYAEACRDSISQYDEFMKQAADLSQAINKYNKKVPVFFRSHISRDFLSVY